MQGAAPIGPPLLFQKPSFFRTLLARCFNYRQDADTKIASTPARLVFFAFHILLASSRVEDRLLIVKAI